MTQNPLSQHGHCRDNVEDLTDFSIIHGKLIMFSNEGDAIIV